jgi:hypothetical protein
VYSVLSDVISSLSCGNVNSAFRGVCNLAVEPLALLVLGELLAVVVVGVEP